MHATKNASVPSTCNACIRCSVGQRKRRSSLSCLCMGQTTRILENTTTPYIEVDRDRRQNESATARHPTWERDGLLSGSKSQTSRDDDERV
jgi:hypothetical protein